MRTTFRTSRRAALAAAAILVAEGCFVYRPVTLPARQGAQLRVSGSSLAVYDGGVVLAGDAPCRATRVAGRFGALHGDTITLTSVWAMSHPRPRGACSRISTATMVLVPDPASVTQRHFSAGRTAGAVVGGVALVAVAAVVVYVEAWKHCDCADARAGRSP